MKEIEDVQPAVDVNEGDPPRGRQQRGPGSAEPGLARTTLNYYYSLQEISDAFSRLKTAIGRGN